MVALIPSQLDAGGIVIRCSRGVLNRMGLIIANDASFCGLGTRSKNEVREYVWIESGGKADTWAGTRDGKDNDIKGVVVVRLQPIVI